MAATFRQAIINRGYMGVKNFINRVIDSEDYHGLNTRAAIRISVQLMDFVHWMLITTSPTNVLGVLSSRISSWETTNWFW